MEQIKPSNYKLGDFAGKSEAWVRKLKKENLEAYDNLLNEYYVFLEKEELMAKKKVIACVNVKGGVGKSSILNILAPKVKKSVIINIDFSSKAEAVNSADTIDYYKLSDDHTIDEILDIALDEYDTVFIDTPGDVSDELMQIIGRINHFILPFKAGKRTINGSIETYDTLFTNNFITGKHKLCMILNEYVNDDEKDKELGKIKHQIEAIELPDDLKIDIAYSSLKMTMVMKTMEEGADSIETLSARNKIAYKAAYKRFNALTDDIITHFKLKKA